MATYSDRLDVEAPVRNHKSVSVRSARQDGWGGGAFTAPDRGEAFTYRWSCIQAAQMVCLRRNVRLRRDFVIRHERYLVVMLRQVLRTGTAHAGNGLWRLTRCRRHVRVQRLQRWRPQRMRIRFGPRIWCVRVVIRRRAPQIRRLICWKRVLLQLLLELLLLLLLGRRHHTPRPWRARGGRFRRFERSQPPLVRRFGAIETATTRASAAALMAMQCRWYACVFEVWHLRRCGRVSQHAHRLIHHGLRVSGVRQRMRRRRLRLWLRLLLQLLVPVQTKKKQSSRI